MNSAQRRKEKKARLKIAAEFAKIVDQIIQELESGKMSLEELKSIKHELDKALNDAV